MNKHLWERYNGYEDEKLFLILMSKPGDFQEEAMETAEKILRDRGHDINLKELFIKKFEPWFDEDLLSIAERNEANYPKIAVEAVMEILDQRGYKLEKKEKKEKREKHNFKPLLLGVLLVSVNLYLSRVIYRYNITGKGPGFLIRYLSEMGVAHDVLLRLIVTALIIYYRNKQKGSYLILWIVAGLAFGGWALIIVGIIELMTNYPVIEKDQASQEAPGLGSPESQP